MPGSPEPAPAAHEDLAAAGRILVEILRPPDDPAQHEAVMMFAARLIDRGRSDAFATAGEARAALDSLESQFLAPHRNLTRKGSLVGTPAYMSPEQCLGAAVDGRSDLYAVGVIFYALLAGRLPFESPTDLGYIGQHVVAPVPRFSELDPPVEVPPALEAYVLRLLEKKPEDRFQNAADARDALDAVEAELEQQPATPSLWGSLLRSVRRLFGSGG